MRKIKTFKEIKKHAGANFQILLIRLDTGDIDEQPYRDVDMCKGALDALTNLALSDILMAPEVNAFFQEKIEEAKKSLESAKSALESLDYGEFYVKGFTPQEALELRSIMDIEKPQPPIKMREVGWESKPPLEQRGQVQAPPLRDEAYADESDPVYLRAVEAWEQEMSDSSLRVIAYTLSKCVQGCNLTDEEIKAELAEEPHPEEPIEEFRLRLGQIGRILTRALSTPVWMSIQEKVNALTGINPERVDFMSLGSPLRSYMGGNRDQ